MKKPSEYIKLAVIYVIMAVVYIYVVHPILRNVAPFLAFQSSEGFDWHAGGLGPYSLAATVFTGIFIDQGVREKANTDGCRSSSRSFDEDRQVEFVRVGSWYTMWVRSTWVR